MLVTACCSGRSRVRGSSSARGSIDEPLGDDEAEFEEVEVDNGSEDVAPPLPPPENRAACLQHGPDRASSGEEDEDEEDTPGRHDLLSASVGLEHLLTHLPKNPHRQYCQ